jgi:uncharacterized protein
LRRPFPIGAEPGVSLIVAPEIQIFNHTSKKKAGFSFGKPSGEVLNMGFASDALDRLVESQIFFPDRTMIQSPKDWNLEYEDTWCETADQVRIHAWLVPAENSDALILFCHGNAGNISHRLDNVSRLHAIGLSVLIFDYRGYGHSEGRITEKGLYLDSEAAHDAARKYADQNKLKLIIFGRSLGGVAAVHLASGRACDGLILESTFTNFDAMAAEHFPVPFLKNQLGNKFNSLGKIGMVSAPILFFHGDVDEIVPYRLGRELYGAAQAPKEFVTISGAGHNDTYFVSGKEYFEKIKLFISELPNAPTGSD